MGIGLVQDTETVVCASCYMRPPRAGSRFCTQKCAAVWADEMTESQVWDPVQGYWIETLS